VRNTALFRLGLVATLLLLSGLTGMAQQRTYRVSGRVVNGTNSALQNVSVWVVDEGRHREIARGVTNDKGEYSLSFNGTGVIKIYYGSVSNVDASLAGNTNHQLTKVVSNIAPVRSDPDQGTP
jgi:hypothetical protein